MLILPEFVNSVFNTVNIISSCVMYMCILLKIINWVSLNFSFFIFFLILICFEGKIQRQLVSLKGRLHFSFEKSLNGVLLELYVLSFTRKLFPIVFRYVSYIDMIEWIFAFLHIHVCSHTFNFIGVFKIY